MLFLFYHEIPVKSQTRRETGTERHGSLMAEMAGLPGIEATRLFRLEEIAGLPGSIRVSGCSREWLKDDGPQGGNPDQPSALVTILPV